MEKALFARSSFMSGRERDDGQSGDQLVAAGRPVSFSPDRHDTNVLLRQTASSMRGCCNAINFVIWLFLGNV